MFTVDTYFGLAVFTPLIAYDTYKAIQMYKLRNPDHLSCSLELYLDFMNVFVRMIKILQEIKK